MSNSLETLSIVEHQEEREHTDEGNSMLRSFDLAISERRQENQSTKHQKEPEPYITNNQYEEPLEQRKTGIVPGKRTYSEASKFRKKICFIGDSHVSRIKRNIFQKLVNRGKTYFDAFPGAASK